MLAIIIALTASTSCTTGKTTDRKTVDRMALFLKNAVSDTLEKDYRSHGIMIKVLVTEVRIHNMTRNETRQDYEYFIRGRVTYVIKGERTWKDHEGNVIVLDPEQEISHWFTCGVLEDRYLHTLYQDEKNRIALYADEPSGKE